MAFNLSPFFRQQILNNSGEPLAGGKIYTYEAGTSTPLATYSDNVGTANTNPIILDSAGVCSLWIGDSSYKFVVKDSNDVTIQTIDNISSPVPTANFSTGDVKLTLKTMADSGWIMMDDKSIGSSASGATGRANADTLDLYTLLWNNVSNTYAPVSSGRGASAALDFAANKTLTLPRSLGRALAAAGAGSGLTSRALGQYMGAESTVLDVTQIPSHTHTQNAHSHTSPAHTHTYAQGGDGIVTVASGANHEVLLSGTTGNTTNATSATIENTTATNQNTGGGLGHTNMQPTMFLNIMIKL